MALFVGLWVTSPLELYVGSAVAQMWLLGSRQQKACRYRYRYRVALKGTPWSQLGLWG